MFIMVTASFFFVCGVSAASQVDFSLQPGESMVVYLDNEYTFTVPDDSAGDYGFFNWTVSERPISHSGLIQSSVVNYAGASMPNITVSAQRDSTYSGNVTFMFDSAVGSGAKVRIYLSVAVTLQNQTDNPISGYMNLNLSAWNYNGNGIPNMGSVNDKLNQILAVLGESPSSSNFLGDDALIYFDGRYFDSCVNGTFSNGLITVSNQTDVRPYLQDATRLVSLTLTPGQYLMVLSYPASSLDENVSFNFPGGGDYSIKEIHSVFSKAGFSSVTIRTYIIDVHSAISFAWIGFNFDVPITGNIFGGIAKLPSDMIYGEAINPDQSGIIDDVDNAGQQQQQQEDQLWNNINSYKGDLTFNLDDWSEAAGGLSYVSGIFMQIWNNSPTQIIVLSLMLGIAMLSIGRGAMAAVRVSRNRQHDD